jgi:hypothetical protein
MVTSTWNVPHGSCSAAPVYVPSAYSEELVAVSVGAGVAEVVGAGVAVSVGAGVVEAVAAAEALASPVAVGRDVAVTAVVLVDVAADVAAISGASGIWNAITRADPAPVSASAMSGLAFLLRMAVNLLEVSRVND